MILGVWGEDWRCEVWFGEVNVRGVMLVSELKITNRSKGRPSKRGGVGWRKETLEV